MNSFNNSGVPRCQPSERGRVGVLFQPSSGGADRAAEDRGTFLCTPPLPAPPPPPPPPPLSSKTPPRSARALTRAPPPGPLPRFIRSHTLIQPPRRPPHPHARPSGPVSGPQAGRPAGPTADQAKRAGLFSCDGGAGGRITHTHTHTHVHTCVCVCVFVFVFVCVCVCVCVCVFILR